MHGYCCHVWAVTLICYLELLDKLKKWICRTVGPSLAASLETLAHCRNVASISLFYTGITLVDVYLNWLNWFQRCYKDVYANSFLYTSLTLSLILVLSYIDIQAFPSCQGASEKRKGFFFFKYISNIV